MPKRILVIGCGSIGERHLRCLLRVGNVEVTACDTNSDLLKKMEQEYRVPVFTNLNNAFSSGQFDGVVICTPAHTHITLALAALRHGAGLLVEKPLSVGFDGLDELKVELANAKKFAGIAYVYHFMPALSQSREFLRGGTLGKPLQISVVGGQHFPTFRPAYREIYYNNHATGGGLIQDALTHLVNAVEWLAGPTRQVFCAAAHQSLEGVTVEDAACVTALNGSTLVSYSLNQFQSPNETTLQIHCERGSLKVEIHEQRWAVFPKGAEKWDYRPAPISHRDDLFTWQAAAFIAALDGKPNSLCTLDEAVQTLKFNLAALQSMRSGQPVLIA